MTDEKELQSQIQELKKSQETMMTQLNAKKAMDDENKNHNARVASMKLAMDHMDDEKKARYIAAVKASDDEESKKAMDEIEKESKKATDKDEKHDAKKDARIQFLEAKLAEPMITKMVSARANSGASKSDIQNFQNSLMTKSYEEIETLYNIVQPMMTTSKPSTQAPYMAGIQPQVIASDTVYDLDSIAGGAN